MRIGERELHPACVLLPALSAEEYRELRNSIEQLGQLEKIVLWKSDGSVLDGRHRLQACLELGLEPAFEELDLQDPWAWVWAKNIDRRHIDPGRRAALRVMYDRGMAELLRTAREAAAERKRSALQKDRAAAHVTLISPHAELPERLLQVLAQRIDPRGSRTQELATHDGASRIEVTKTDKVTEIWDESQERTVKSRVWAIWGVSIDGKDYAGNTIPKRSLHRVARQLVDEHEKQVNTARGEEIEEAAGPAAPDPEPVYKAPWVEVDFPQAADGSQSVRATLPEREESGQRPRDLLASVAGCSPRTAQKVIQLLDRPDLLEEVCHNTKTLEQAFREARRPTDSDWVVHEAYYTPAWPIELLARSGYLGVVVGLAVEPCVGDGAIVRALGELVKIWITCDVRDVEPAHDGLHLPFSWLDGEPKKRLTRQQLKRLREAEVVITNPIFSRAQEVVETAWELCPHADVWVLHRRTWHDAARGAWFAAHQPDELNISPRIRFLWPDGSPVAEGTDNTIYTWYGFSPGNRQPCPGPNGGITRTLVRPDPNEE